MRPLLTRAGLASVVLLAVAALLQWKSVNEMARVFIKRSLPSIFGRTCFQHPVSPPTSSSRVPLTSIAPSTPRYTRTFTTASSRLNPNTKASNMANTTNFFEAVANRHSYYQLSDSSPIPDSRIQRIVEDTLLNVPSAFNSQTTRLVLVLKAEHKKLWQLIREVYKQQLPADKFEHANQRFNGFEAAYGTVLCYEDTTTVREFQEKFKTYEDKFPAWSEQTNGMHQHVMWTAFDSEGLGCNLQHYSPLIDVRIETEFHIPSTWSLKAQLVFGKPEGEKPGAKPKNELEKTLMVVGK